MLQQALYIIIAFLIVHLPAKQPSQSEGKPILQADNYEVYSALLSEIARETETIVILNETTDNRMVQPLFKLSSTYILIGKRELNEIFRRTGAHPRDGWKAYYEKYPGSGGYLKLSRVEFEAGRKQAKVMVEHYCGWLCASGVYYTMIKGDEGWVIQDRKLSWVS